MLRDPADDVAHRLRRRRLRGEDPQAVGHEHALLGVHHRALDAGAPDVDAQDLHEGSVAYPAGSAALGGWGSGPAAYRGRHGSRGEPGRSPHRPDPALARASTTAASSATSARGPASSGRASAGVCFVAGPRRRPGRADHLRPLERLLRRPDREEAAQPLPARHRPCCRSARPAATWPAASARTGTSRSRRRSTGWPTRRRPTHIAAAAVELGCASVAFTYNDPVIFVEYAIDVADACHERRRAVGRRDRRLHVRRAAARALRAHGRRQRRPQGLHRGVLPAPGHGRPRARARHARATSGTRPTCGSRSRRCSSPGSTTPTTSSTPSARWIADELGTDVPLHFTAFHPDYKMTRRARRRRRPRCAGPAPSRCGNGLRHVYTRQRARPRGRHHACPSCGTPVIVRDWYEITTYGLDDTGRCRSCGEPAARRVRRPGRDVGRPAPYRCACGTGRCAG